MHPSRPANWSNRMMSPARGWEDTGGLMELGSKSPAGLSTHSTAVLAAVAPFFGGRVPTRLPRGAPDLSAAVMRRKEELRRLKTGGLPRGSAPSSSTPSNEKGDCRVRDEADPARRRRRTAAVLGDRRGDT